MASTRTRRSVARRDGRSSRSVSRSRRFPVATRQIGSGRARGDVELEARDPRRQRQPRLASPRAGLVRPRRLGEQGLGVILISHNLHDVLQMQTGSRCCGSDVTSAMSFERRTTTQQAVLLRRSPPVSDGEVSGHSVHGRNRGHVSTGGGSCSSHRAPERFEEEQLPDGRGLWQRVWPNLRTGNLGPAPIIGEVLLVIILRVRGDELLHGRQLRRPDQPGRPTAMLAFGVVFVLLSDHLSIGYVAGIGELVVAELQLPGSGHQYPGLIADGACLAVCAGIGLLQGSIIAFAGRAVRSSRWRAS